MPAKLFTEHRTTGASVYIMFGDEDAAEPLVYEPGLLCGQPSLTGKGSDKPFSSDLSCRIAQMPVTTR